MNTTKIIFLDIDGVLQPIWQQERHRHDLEALPIQLAKKLQNDDYLEMDKYDLGAVYYDWNNEAVENLRSLCEKTKAKIVISSDWRKFSPLETLKAYFKLHNLDSYIFGETQLLDSIDRSIEIKDYLHSHPDIEQFVILDDNFEEQFNKHYPKHFVHCEQYFNDSCYQKAQAILTSEHDSSFLQKVEEGFNDLKEGNLSSTEKVLSGLRSKINQKVKPE